MNYPYANGIIKAIEGNLFDKAKYAKLTKTDRVDFVAALTGFGYGNGAAGDSLESIIGAELLNLKKLLFGISPDLKYTDLFCMTYDAMNLKVLYKAKVFGVTRPDTLSPLGAIRPDALAKAVLEGDLSGVAKEYVPLLENVGSIVQGIENPRRLSAAIDNAVFAFVFRMIRHCPGNAMQAYYQGFVDFANVITLIRSRVLKWDFATFSEMMTPEGLIPAEVFERAYSLEGDPLAKAFMAYYSEKITKLIRKFQENPDLDRLERLFDGLLLEIVSEYRFDAFRIGPIIYYFLKKQAEAKNIRLIYATGTADSADLL